MERKKFFDQYKDPRWQKKRLEIMQRDNFQCQSCKKTETALNVHHKTTYRKNIKPWEYENDELITWCENCHKEITSIIDDCKSILIGNCRDIETSKAMYLVLMELDSVSPGILRIVSKVLEGMRKDTKSKYYV